VNLHRALLLPVSLLAAQSVFADCDHEASRSADLDATGARKLVVSVAAGDLVVLGESGATRVRANGDACAASAAALEGIQLDARRDGDIVRVTAVMPKQRFALTQARLDLQLSVPASIELELQDSSGDIEIKTVAAARIDDSSGDQSIRDIAGDVSIDDSSGDVEIESVRGNVVVRDSSGDVKVTDVAGNVAIPVDSSGHLGLRRIRGDVHIGSDSSGDIVLTEINQNVRIDYDSSGDIRAADIGGDFTVETDSTGDIAQRNVLGQVRIPRQD